jgi:hypothetical protein
LRHKELDTDFTRFAPADEIDAFARQFRTDGGHAGHVVARPGEALHQSVLDRIPDECHHDRNLAGRPPGGERGRRKPGDDQVNFDPHQLRR